MNDDLVVKGSLLEENDLDTEYRIRKSEFLVRKISKTESIPDGWEIQKEFKTTYRIAKKKNVPIALEDKVWELFYDIGAQKISTREFTIILKKRGDIEKTKQLDIAAVDGEIVFVVECKTQERLGKSELKKDIAEFVLNQNDIRNAIKEILGNKDLDFVFILATENIELSDNDKLDAKESNILIWDEYDILALQELAKLAGQGAKYQIYNRVFFGKKIKGLKVRVPALEAKMGGITYFTFVLSPNDLLKIAFVHHRSGQSSFLELSDSYQRIINAARVRKIAQYIEEENGFFPGSIILNFHRNFTEKENLGSRGQLDQVTNKVKPVILTLPPYYGCAWIIDGQHRLYGYADVDKKQKETIPVVAFVDVSNSLEAKMFVDINKNQKSIEANLLWDLYEDLYLVAKNEKEQQLYAISKIAKDLNHKTHSPFYGHIAIPKDQNSGNITLTTVCTTLKQQKLVDQKEGLFFYNTYSESIDFASDRIAAFFDVIKGYMPDEWELGDRHYIRTNAGLVVLLGILRDIVECNLSKSEKEDLNKFKKVAEKFLEPLIIHFMHADSDMINNYRGAGGAGQKSRQVRYELTKVIRDANIGFRSIWLETFEESLSEEKKFAKHRKGILHFLDNEESENLEFKGAIALDLNRYLKGDGKLSEKPELIDDGVLKTIVAFLNSKGGDLIIGVLEKSKFEDVYEEKLSSYPLHNGKIIFGIEIEYKKDEWDGYLQRLTSLIETRIGSEVLDSEYIKIERVKHEERELCHVSVQPSDSKQYLVNMFFVRRANKTVQLEGQEIDRYWQSRKSTS